jgi:hypothetical protein
MCWKRMSAANGRCVARSPWGFGVAMVIVELALVALTMALEAENLMRAIDTFSALMRQSSRHPG